MSDLRFLPQTLTFHRSLLANSADFRLIVLCMDEPSHTFLGRRALPCVEVVELEALQRADPELAEKRNERSWREYCWTAIPAFCHLMLGSVAPRAVVAWIDSDVEVVRDPAFLLEELGDGSILLTPHRYNRAYPIAAPGTELAARYGRFNGGTIAFRHDADGTAAAGLWRERTLRGGGYDSFTPERFGNQLHIDDFADLFGGTRILPVPGGILGPWNGGRFKVSVRRTGPVADRQPVFAYHFQSLRLEHASPPLAQAVTPNLFGLGSVRPSLQARAEPHYRISPGERRVFWRPYLGRLEHAVLEVMRDEPRFIEAVSPAPRRTEVLDATWLKLKLRFSRVVAPVFHHIIPAARSALSV